MRQINIFALTRISDPDALSRLERQMSKRATFLKIKEWEVQGLRLLADQLYAVTEESADLCFYYSFVMPKLGKEFDLLRISEHSILNIELKSGNVTEDVIRRQLLLNRHYLSSLGKEVYSYTYISNENRLLKLTNGNHLQEADWNQLVNYLQKQGECYEGDIEDLFKEEHYLISPLSDPERFLRREYFLTSQQYDIKRKILKNIHQKGHCFQGFTGLPGTGKSNLLYDIAMELSVKEKIALLHIGLWPDNLTVFSERLKRIDFYYCEKDDQITLQGEYKAIVVDESHRISKQNLESIVSYAQEKQIPIVFTYDREDAIALQERPINGVQLIESLPDFTRYPLTNRIRVNDELSSFIQHMMNRRIENYRKFYPSVQIYYANQKNEAESMLRYFKEKGYEYIADEYMETKISIDEADKAVQTSDSIDFDQVVMLVDHTFWYDVSGYLRCTTKTDQEHSCVRNLFHGMNRAKRKLAVVILDNPEVFKTALHIVEPQ